MEVLHASAPGARMRVMRAAYHSSAGPGAPAASYLMHSSRRVISSGFNLMESPSFPTKPLEISSTPLESSPESNIDAENYKVTEPDDFDISAPSKWKSTTGGTSIRMPSEESSSTDNASIIDLDSRHHKSVFRKYSNDSENSDIPSIRRNISRVSPLLDAPVALSTLKYKSLLNGSSEWNNRRKSYSFEDTSPLNETIVHSNDTLAMESSTDSGICKSTEIVNDTDDNAPLKYLDRKERKHEDTFQDWLSKNRSNSSFYKGNQVKSYREHDIVIEDPLENSIALQSTGKVSITVPVTVETGEDYHNKKTHINDDGDKRIKRVEFCKTELHFAAESGKVNIIATDEKPPPTNDFRKRRSAFVPINGNFEKPITLFGEINKNFVENGTGDISTYKSEIGDYDENTAATKSILKNKIPKPKPYLLGENMVFGESNESLGDELINKKEALFNYVPIVPTAITLIKRQQQTEKNNEITSRFSSETDTSVIRNNAFRTTNKGPSINDSLQNRKNVFEVEENASTNKETNTKNSVKTKLKVLQLSPIQGRAKTRQLRDSDLTFFGVNDLKSNNTEKNTKYKSNGIDDIFQSVRLIQQISNSVCNSEAESEDSPEYQNIPLRTNFAPIPTPRTRSTYESKPEFTEVRLLKPLIEQEGEANKNVSETRRSKLRRREETTSSRSISEPPKPNRYNSLEKAHRRRDQLGTHDTEKEPTSRPNRNHATEISKDNDITRKSTLKKNIRNKIIEEAEPLYANYNIDESTNPRITQNGDLSPRRETRSNVKVKSNSLKSNAESLRKESNSNSNYREDKDKRGKIKKPDVEVDKDSLQNKQQSDKNKNRVKRTEKLATPEYSSDSQRKLYDKASLTRKTNTPGDKVDEQNTSHKAKQNHRSRSTQNHAVPHKLETEENVKDLNLAVEENGSLQKDALQYNTRQSLRDKTSGRKDSSKTQKLDIDSSDTYRNSSKSRKEISSTERVSNGKTDIYKPSKRSEYVINYDDKKGTVSSICKVTPGTGTSKKKRVLKEKVKESPKEYKVRNKSPEKNALLQFPDRQWNPNGLSYADKKWKKKMHVHRTCQVL